MKNKLTNYKNDAHHVMSLIQRGIDAWVEAGKYIALKIDSNPDYLDKLAEQLPDVSPEYLRRFEQIGRYQLHPRILLSTAPGVRHLAKLPYHEQEKYLDQPVTVLVPNEGNYDTLKMDIRNMTKLQADQVFDTQGVRSPAAQRAWLEDRAARRMCPPSNHDLPYRVTAKTLVVMEPCTLNRRELAKLLSEMA